MLKLRFLFLVTVLVCVQLLAAQGNGQSEGLPLLVHADLPLYPAVAHTARITGKVEAQVTVKGGVVTDVKLEPGSHPSSPLQRPKILRLGVSGPTRTRSFPVCLF